MKKVYQLITAVVLSAATTGAFAQTPGTKIAPRTTSNFKEVSLSQLRKANNTHRAMSSGYNYSDVDYVQGDIAWTGGTFYHWLPSLYINAAFKLGDTNTSPLSSASANTYTPTSCTVVYDTLWDVYQGTGGQFSTIPMKAGSVAVDTITAYCVFFNSSGMNDTLLFNVTSVTATGMPSGTVYGVDTVVLNTSNMSYNSTDSVQIINIPLAHPIMIPAAARHGWNFAINLTTKNVSKSDTVGVWYYSQGVNCGSYGQTPAYTSMGVADGRASAVNSFVTGLYWFNSTVFKGTGTAMTWPGISGSSAGWCQNGSYYWYDQLGSGSCATDTSYFPMQDIGIAAHISFLDPTSVNNVNESGLTVGQNYPNPFNQRTQVAYNLTKASDVVFTVTDMAGRMLVNNTYSTVAPGQHIITMDANQFSPGVYFYTFNVNGTTVTKKMVITQ